MKQIIIFTSLLLLAASCQSYPPEVEEALQLSGNNCVELQKVLEHFKDRGQVAYESACFLIGNMKYHQSSAEKNVTPSHEKYFAQTDSIFEQLFGTMTWEEIGCYHSREHDSLRHELADVFAKLPVVKRDTTDKQLSDLQTVKSVFLIDHIESALRIWQKEGYEYAADFDFFKEMILPYRSYNESLGHDRTTQQQLFRRFYTGADTLSTNDLIERFHIYTIRCRWINEYIKPKRHLGIYDLLMPAFQGSCPELCSWSTNVLRSCGVPAICEFTPKWIDRDSGHFWCVSPDSCGILLPYTAPDNKLLGDWEQDIKWAGKVYRMNFGAQKDSPYFLAGNDEIVPGNLNSPLLSDQTFRYRQTVTLRLPFNGKGNSRLAYLCLFSIYGSRSYMPVGWGRIDRKRKEVVFEQVPLNVQFFPVYYNGKQLCEIDTPFMLYAPQALKEVSLPLTANVLEHPLEISLSNGRLLDCNGKEVEGLHYHPLVCDTLQRTHLHLLRKYPPKRLLMRSLKQMQGSFLLGSNQETGIYDTLAVLSDVPIPYIQEVALHTTKAYRYYRFCSVNGPVNLAHIEFLASGSDVYHGLCPTPLPVFSVDSAEVKANTFLYRIEGTPYFRFPFGNPEHALDGDINTFAKSPEVGMYFDTPVRITHIRFLPRIANNGIVPGDVYKLLYYDGGWKEFQTVRAQYNYLDFEEVPVATLYWLRNLSDGKEELPFYYKNGKQYFLHIDDVPVE